MRKTRVLSLLLALSLLFVLVPTLSGCRHKIVATDLMAEITPRESEPATVPDDASAFAVDFAARLFRATYDGKNTLLSPLSALVALAMTANGAAGETRAQMESALGLTVGELNAFFAAYLASLKKDDGVTLAVADSIWLRDDPLFSVKEDFLQINADVYRAGAFRAPFDKTTVKDVNQWVKDHTDGLIDKILDDLRGDDLALLVNALLFDGKWAAPYTLNTQKSSGLFHKEDGTDATVTFLSSGEDRYLSDRDRAVGFIKPYVGGRYAFAALLPAEGTALADYVATLSGERITEILTSAENVAFHTKMPKFETRFETDLKDALSAMGMTDAFLLEKADFSGISETTPLYLGEVIHKTFIEVGEKGTRAGAVTAPRGKGASPQPDLEVVLDRPFVYILFDTTTNIPLFIGTLNDPNG